MHTIYQPVMNPEPTDPAEVYGVRKFKTTIFVRLIQRSTYRKFRTRYEHQENTPDDPRRMGHWKRR